MTNTLYYIAKHYCGANKRRSTSKPKKIEFNKFIPPLTNWAAFTIGILCGILMATIVIFTFISSRAAPNIPPKIQTKMIAKNDATDPEAHAKEKFTVVAEKSIQEPKFDFYTELSEDSHDSDKSKSSGSQVLDLKSAPKPINKYLVQAGSFKRRADADALKAKLTLNGLQAKIELVRLNEDEYWHRVLLGPFPSETLAAEQKQLLKTLEVDAILVLKSAE